MKREHIKKMTGPELSHYLHNAIVFKDRIVYIEVGAAKLATYLNYYAIKSSREKYNLEGLQFNPLNPLKPKSIGGQPYDVILYEFKNAEFIVAETNLSDNNFFKWLVCGYNVWGELDPREGEWSLRIEGMLSAEDLYFYNIHQHIVFLPDPKLMLTKPIAFGNVYSEVASTGQWFDVVPSVHLSMLDKPEAPFYSIVKENMANRTIYEILPKQGYMEGYNPEVVKQIEQDLGISFKDGDKFIIVQSDVFVEVENAVIEIS